MGTKAASQTNEDIIGRSLNMAGLAAFQTGVIVSRTIIDRKTGTVTLFAFDKGQALSEHSAPFDALVLGLEGEGEVMIDGRAHRVATGEMIIMPAGHPHSLKALIPFKMALVMIRS